MSDKGRSGEDAAAAFLTASGYRVLGRNVRVPGGEIDAVCLDGTTLVVVEVKRRDSSSFGSALAAVDARKRDAAAHCRGLRSDRRAFR